ncbi:periplasmic heavy metal sensor [Deltaproteobacteria bacterium]|nr:periplasmic heavy metal sensor [Deltaproteobacteria bacterium]
MKRITGIMTMVLLVFALAVPVTAQVSGRGMAGRMMMGQGEAAGPQRVRGMGNANLTTEQREELEKARKAFLDDTVDLRNDIKTRNTELDNLLRTADPDANKAKAIRKEISDLQGNLAQKRLELRLETLKINPDARYGMGSGRNMMGAGTGIGRQ